MSRRGASDPPLSRATGQGAGSLSHRTKPAELTRTRHDGSRYTRRPEIEAALSRLLDQPRDDVLAALAVRDARSDKYIPSECIVHLVRQARHDNASQYFERLYRELMRRLAAALPRVSGERAAEIENIHAANARDRVRDVFIAKLVEDHRNPGADLDYFEVVFADAVASLRASALRKSGREAARSEPIEFDRETNEPSIAVERAAGSLDVKEALLSEDPIYRSRVMAAIDALPEKERRVIEMVLQDMPLDSSDEQVLSIRRVLGVAEKTVRNRRDAALRRIREALGIGTEDD